MINKSADLPHNYHRIKQSERFPKFHGSPKSIKLTLSESAMNLSKSVTSRVIETGTSCDRLTIEIILTSLNVVNNDNH